MARQVKVSRFESWLGYFPLCWKNLNYETPIFKIIYLVEKFPSLDYKIFKFSFNKNCIRHTKNEVRKTRLFYPISI